MVIQLSPASKLLQGIGCDEQGFEKARLQVRRDDDLLRFYAAFENEQLEQSSIIVERATPFTVVVGDVKRVIGCPAAP